ncbi:MAG: class IV adenylate cyclase [Pirellulaceae bacterium]|nr:class IV adenylate cyclase [Pirellulaceae bacterium]
MFEVEQKFHVDNLTQLERQLLQLQAVEQATQQHVDTYYNHPCRDFAETLEALRVRLCDGVPMVTYKGTKLPGAIKARRELEWRLDPGDPDGLQMQQLLSLLGFRSVAMVKKTRRLFCLPGNHADLVVTIDDVQQVGLFSEIELIVDEEGGIETARAKIQDLAAVLGLQQAESRSYLRMLLGAKKSPPKN